MPDGLTHILVDYIFLRKRCRGGRMALVLSGALLPDILLRGGRLFFIGHPNHDFLELFLVPMHTPVTSILACLVLSQIFHTSVRKDAFMCLVVGCFSHFFLDFFQRTIHGFGFSTQPYGGYHWLYPLTWYDIQCGLLWAEDTLLLLVVLIPSASYLRLKKHGHLVFFNGGKN